MEVSSHALAHRPGRRGAVRRRRLHQLRPRPPRLPRRRRRLLRGQGQAVRRPLRRRGAQPRRPGAGAAGAARPRSPTRRPATRRRPGAPPTSRRTATGSGSPRSARTGWRVPRRGGAARPAQRGQRAARASPAWSRSASTRRTAADGDRRLPAACPAGWSGSAAPGPVLGVVDYAHKPDAIVAALAALRELAAARGGRLICVHRRRRRPGPGQAPADGRGRGRAAPTCVIVTDDNPRTEDPAADPRRGARRAPRGRPARGRRGRRPAGRDRRGGPRWPARATWSRCWARGTSAARRSPARCTRSTTGSSWPPRCARALRHAGRRRDDPDDPGRDRGRRRRHARRRRPGRDRSPAPVEFDSRKVAPGGLFVAFAGEQGRRARLRRRRGRRRRGRRARHPGRPARPAIVVDDPLRRAGPAGPRGASTGCPS